jgi:ketosteroid isomerase-like protein
MRTVRTLVWSALFCGLAALPAYAADTGGAPSVDAAWVKAMEAGNVDGLMKCFAPDAVVWVGGLPTADNAKAIHIIFNMYLAQNKLKNIKLSPLGSKTLGDLSVSWGTYSATSVPAGGGGQAPTQLEGRYTDIAKKVGGRWVFVVNHLSEEPPQFSTPPPDAGPAPK